MINELDSDRNKYELKEGNKWMVWRFSKKDFWKCIGYIILEVTNGKKVCRLWRKPHKYNYGQVKGKLKREIIWKKYLLKLSCHPYCFNYPISFYCRQRNEKNMIQLISLFIGNIHIHYLSITEFLSLVPLMVFLMIEASQRYHNLVIMY